MDINPEEFARPDVAKEKGVSGEKTSSYGDRNRYFGQVDRGPYQLGHLLRDLPKRHTPLTSDTYLMAEAAASHASNGISALLYGLDAIGHLMIVSGCGDEYEPDKRKFTALGEVIQHIAVEVQFLMELRDSVEWDMREYDERTSNANTCTCSEEKEGV